MTDENSIATSGATGKEERRVIDDSFLECLASAESLIDKCPMRSQGDLGERMIHLTSGTVLFAIILVETLDSFIISYPATLTNTNGKVSGRLMMDTLQSRLFKSCIVTISKPADLHKYYYLRFLMEDLAEVPSVFNNERLEAVLDFLNLHEQKETPVKEPRKSKVELLEEEDDDEEPSGYDDVPSRMFAPYRKKTRH